MSEARAEAGLDAIALVAALGRSDTEAARVILDHADTRELACACAWLALAGLDVLDTAPDRLLDALRTAWLDGMPP